MINLARQLVFGSYDDGGNLLQTFRITEDQTIADPDDEITEFPATETVGIVHPAHLDEATKSSWGEVLADYAIFPPFQQLGRPVLKPAEADLDKTEITFEGKIIGSYIKNGILKRNQWHFKSAGNRKSVQHSKQFKACSTVAFITFSSKAMGRFEEREELKSIYFVPAKTDRGKKGAPKNRIKIGEVDPGVISEVLRLANVIVSKAES